MWCIFCRTDWLPHKGMALDGKHGAHNQNPEIPDEAAQSQSCNRSGCDLCHTANGSSLKAELGLPTQVRYWSTLNK